MLEIYVGFRAGGWGGAFRTYSTAAHVLRRWEKMWSRKVKSSWSSTSKRDREDNLATSVSEQSFLRPQSVPGRQPSCERLPPARWAVVGLGVGMMALCCAVVCCVEYGCSGPSINTTLVVSIIYDMSSDFKGAIADNLHQTQSPPQVDHYYYYTSTYRYSFYHGTLEQWRRCTSEKKYSAVSATTRCTTADAFPKFVPKLCWPIIYQDKHDR